MKRFLVPCILGLFGVGLWCSQAAADVTLNQDNFPDEALRSYITTSFADCSKLKEIWIPDFPDIDPVAFYNHRSDFCIVTDDEELIEWAGQNGIMTKSEDSL